MSWHSAVEGPNCLRDEQIAQVRAGHLSRTRRGNAARFFSRNLLTSSTASVRLYYYN